MIKAIDMLGSAKLAEPFAHSVKSLSQFFEVDVTSLIQFTYRSDPRQVVVHGMLDEPKESTYQVCYAVPLRDDSSTVLLDVKKSLLAASNIQGGEYVRVVGVVKPVFGSYTGNRIEMRLDVSEIKAMESPVAVDTMRKEQVTIAKLKSMISKRNPFPFGVAVRISVILSKQSQVRDDFMSEVSGVPGLSVAFVTANMTSVDEVVKAIREASCDILVVIRGGGDDSQFEVFNNMQVITAIKEHSAYRVLGVGHSGNSTMSDMVCDFSANTPTQAGTHIKNMIDRHEAVISAINKDRAALSDSLRRAIDENLVLADQVKKKERGAGDLFLAIQRHYKPFGIAAAVIFLLGMLVAYKLRT